MTQPTPALSAEEMAEPRKRKLVVDTADYWFQCARDPQYSVDERMLYYENAVNHLEGALVALRSSPAPVDRQSEGEVIAATIERCVEAVEDALREFPAEQAMFGRTLVHCLRALTP